MLDPRFEIVANYLGGKKCPTILKIGRPPNKLYLITSDLSRELD